MFITLAILGAIAGGILVGRGTKGVLDRRGVRHSLEAGCLEFQRRCDECRIAVGELVNDSKGEWVGGQLRLGGLVYTSVHSLTIGRLVSAELHLEDCRYCGSRMHVLFEVAERVKAKPKADSKAKSRTKKPKEKTAEPEKEQTAEKENFARLLCSICPNLNCGLIERNGGYTHSSKYGALLEAADNVRAFLIALENSRQDLALTGLDPPLLPGPGETTGE